MSLPNNTSVAILEIVLYPVVVLESRVVRVLQGA